MKKTINAQIVDEVATLESAIILMQAALDNLTRLRQELQDNPMEDSAFKPEDLEAQITEARNDIKRARALQEAAERALATADTSLPGTPLN